MSSNYNIRRLSHGGHCCGIVHLVSFSCNPEDTLAADDMIDDTITGYPNTLYKIKRPAEKAIDRLRHHIEAIDQGRSSGVTEIVLTDGQLDAYKWEPILLGEFGFVRVTRTRNSNSGNYINIYHRT